MFQIEFFALSVDYVDLDVITKLSKWTLSNIIENPTEALTNTVNSTKNLYDCD